MLILACMAAATALSAQSQTVQGFNAGSTTENNLCVVIGQPFDAITSQNGYEMAEGVLQAQLVTEDYSDTVSAGIAYTKHGFNYPATTPVGIYQSTLYTPGGAIYGYDLLASLTLEVLIPCGEIVYDGDQNPYPTVRVARQCWIRKNLRARHYADGVTEIATARAYETVLHPDATANEDTYGLLYSWFSAVKVPENGTEAPVPDADGYVKGICPDGWHIPTETEMASLKTLPAEDIRTVDQWLVPNENTNSTGFSALPAGRYNASTNRFEGLGTQTDWWSVSDGLPVTPSSLQLQYYCDTPLSTNPAASDALSVRCVKNH